MVTLEIIPEVIPDKWLIKLHRDRRSMLARKFYYELVLHRYRRFNTTMEIVLGLTSGTVLGLKIWNLLIPPQFQFYASSTAIAIFVIIGILKPILRLSDKIDENRIPLEIYKRAVKQFDELAFIIETDKLLTIGEFNKIYASILRGIEFSGPEEYKLDKFYKTWVNNMLPEDSWKISYISAKSKFSAREKNEP